MLVPLFKLVPALFDLHPKAVHEEVEKSGPVLLIADFRQISISLIY
jgi:hypothetical protein